MTEMTDPGPPEPVLTGRRVRLRPWREGTGELGYWVAAPVRGRGLATDALDTLARWLFTRPHPPAARLELLVEPGNTASRAVAAAAGFVEEGTLRSRLLLDGVRRDVVVSSRLPSDPGPAVG